MNKKSIAVALAAGVVMVQGLAYAATITGTVVNIDPSARKLVISEKSAAGAKAADKAYKVLNKASFHGFKALQDLKPGQMVQVSAKMDPKTHAEEATSIKLEGAAS